MKNLIENKQGNAKIILLAIMTVIMGFGMLTIGTYIYFAIASNADAGTLVASEGRISQGSFSFNGSNISSDAPGTITNVTITNGAAVYIFEFNTTAAGTQACRTANCILVNVRNTNTSLGAATNLTTAINANASVNASVTAARSGNITFVNSNFRSTAGNSIVLSDDSLPTDAAIITTTTMTGGVNDVTGQSSQNTLNNYVATTMPLFGLALMILGLAVIIITVRGSLGGNIGRQ